MVATHSCMLPLGTPAPAFNLKDVVSGDMVSLQKKIPPMDIWSHLYATTVHL